MVESTVLKKKLRDAEDVFQYSGNKEGTPAKYLVIEERHDLVTFANTPSYFGSIYIQVVL